MGLLKEVPMRTTAEGNPSRLVGGKEYPVRLDRPSWLTRTTLRGPIFNFLYKSSIRLGALI